MTTNPNTGEDTMNERSLEEMNAMVVIEQNLFQALTASNVGLSNGIVFDGGHIYLYEEAVIVINAIDRALLSCPKHLQKRIRAQRMSFVFAFGPEMEAVCGFPPKLR